MIILSLNRYYFAICSKMMAYCDHNNCFAFQLILACPVCPVSDVYPVSIVCPVCRVCHACPVFPHNIIVCIIFFIEDLFFLH